jgi:hypothetical protein
MTTFDSTSADYVLNISLHVLILFVFLSVFFFQYASKLASDSINSALGSVIDTQLDKLLDTVDEVDNRTTKYDINWEEVDKLAKNVEDSSQDDLPEIEDNNKHLKKIAIIMSITLLTIFVSFYVYFRFIKGLKVSLGNVIIENLIFFSFIGVIEYLFFVKIAAKYIPVTPDFVSTTLLDRIKYNVDKTIS